jgi:hypothetical protein
MDALKHAFFFQFPMTDNKTIRAQWCGHSFTNPTLSAFSDKFSSLKDWSKEIIPPFRFMVHCVSEPSTWGGKTDPVGELSKYDFTSMTLLDSSKRFTYFNNGGMIFNVAKSNIIVTYGHDLMSNTHSSASGSNTELSLADEIKTLSFGTGGLKTPDQIIAAQSATGAYGLSVTTESKYNEIAICGRPGVPLPWGMTSTIELRAVFAMVPKSGKMIAKTPQERKAGEWKTISEQLNVPMLYIPTDT